MFPWDNPVIIDLMGHTGPCDCPRHCKWYVLVMNCSTAHWCPDPPTWGQSVSHSFHVCFFFRGCKSFDYSCPTGLAFSHDGRMYVCELDSLTVCQIDGSKSNLSIRPGPNKELFDNIHCVRVCRDDGIMVNDESDNLTKYSKDGQFIWTIKSKTASPSAFCLDSSDLLYCATSDQVKVYSPSGAFSHVLVRWEKDDNMACQSAWFYRCNHNDQFLTTHFLHVLHSGTRVFIVTYLFTFLQPHPIQP